MTPLARAKVPELGPIERAARILFWMNFGDKWVEASELVRVKYMKEARAVLDELREPSDEMIDAGHDGMSIARCDVATVWQAMVAAALEKGK